MHEFKCVVCGNPVKGEWNRRKQTWEPVSRYWKDLDTAVFCSPKCGLKHYNND